MAYVLDLVQHAMLFHNVQILQCCAIGYPAVAVGPLFKVSANIMLMFCAYAVVV